jgi:hypothetical protein
MNINDDLLKLEGALALGFTTSISNQTANFTLSSAQTDKVSVVKIIQTTPGISCLSIVAPSSTSTGKILKIINDITSTASIDLTFISHTLRPGSFVDLIWAGANWIKEQSTNVFARISPIGSAVAGSEITLGELSFRYNANAVTGNLEIRSSTASTVSVQWQGLEQYPQTPTAAISAPIGGSATGILTANANTGVYTALGAMGLGYNERLEYYITTQNNCYTVELRCFNNGQLFIKVEKFI